MGTTARGGRIEDDRLGEGLVNGALRQDFGVGIIGGRLFRRRNVAGGGRIRRRVLSGIRCGILGRKEIGGGGAGRRLRRARILRLCEVLLRKSRDMHSVVVSKSVMAPATTSPRTRRPFIGTLLCPFSLIHD